MLYRDGFRPTLPPLPTRRPRPAIRTDAISTGDSIASILLNELTGAGDSSDPNGAWSIFTGGRELWPQEIARLASHWLGQRVVSEHPLWLWCAGARIELDGATDRAPLDAALLDLGARDVFRLAHELARTLGGAGVLIRTDPQGPLDRPLDLTGRRIVALVPIDGYHLRVKRLGRSPLSPRYLRPTRYAIDHTGEDDEWWAGDVHWSHILDFYGPRRVLPELAPGRWSEWPSVSVLQVAWEAVRGYLATSLSNEDAMRRLSVFVVKHPDFLAKMANDPDAFAELLTTITQKLGTRDTYHSPPGGDVSTASLSLSGLGEGNAWFKEQLAIAADIPHPLLFEASGSGLSKETLTWDAWTTRLTGHASASGLMDAYRRLVDHLLPTLYRRPVTIRRIEPGDFRQPSDAERMQLRVLGAQEAATIVATGIAPAAAFTEARYRGAFATDIMAPEVLPVPAVTADAADRYAVPAGARGNARQVLEWRREHPDTRGMTETGWARARQLATEDTISAEDMREIRAWFARHGAQRATRAVSPEYADTPWRDAGYVAWLGWGGDTMAAHVARLTLDAADGTLIALEVDPASVSRLAAQVRAILPDLAPELWPHVTLLYLGAVPDRDLPTVERAAAASRPWPTEIEADTVGPLGDHGAIVLHLRARGLAARQARLLRALAPRVRAEQFPAFLPHVTLGYLPRALTDAEIEALDALDLPTISTPRLTLRAGPDAPATWSL